MASPSVTVSHYHFQLSVDVIIGLVVRSELWGLSITYDRRQSSQHSWRECSFCDCASCWYCRAWRVMICENDSRNQRNWWMRWRRLGRTSWKRRREFTWYRRQSVHIRIIWIWIYVYIGTASAICHRGSGWVWLADRLSLWLVCWSRTNSLHDSVIGRDCVKHYIRCACFQPNEASSVSEVLQWCTM